MDDIQYGRINKVGSLVHNIMLTINPTTHPNAFARVKSKPKGVSMSAWVVDAMEHGSQGSAPKEARTEEELDMSGMAEEI